MPLFRTSNARLLYFAHVPKCAGTTVERYLEARFGAPAFLDRTFNAADHVDRWSATSPQHMPEAVRARYLPDSFLDEIFATVRHPATRLRSVFLFQREIEEKIPADRSFEHWLDGLEVTRERTPDAFDGHLRPMSDYVPANARIFRVEEGLDILVAWIDRISGTTAPETKMRRVNDLGDRLRFNKKPVPEVALSAEVLAQVAALYAADYARFDYAVTPPPTGETP